MRFGLGLTYKQITYIDLEANNAQHANS